MNVEKKRGASVLDVVLIVFVILKLTGLIHWKWVWILSPIWIQLALALVILIVKTAREPADEQ